MSPSAYILKQAENVLETIDKGGRKLKVRRPAALDTLRLFKAAGPILSQNEAWLSLAAMAVAVVEMDGIPVPAPTTESQIESLVDRLGDDGISAVASILSEPVQKPDDRAEVGN